MVSWAIALASLPAFAQDAASNSGGGTDSKNVPDAANVSSCKGQIGKGTNAQEINTIPSNCLFLEEPIGGQPNVDLYKVDCTAGICTYTLYNGAPVTGNARGPIQAVLTRTAGKEYQGPFGLLYNYLSLIYTYMSGLIIGVAVLFVVVGGIQIATSGGETTGVTNGKKRIIQAITGVILWFTASLILYTINPTFFSY